VAAVIALAEELGLEPPPSVEPLPEIDERDINLVTWLALVSGNATTDSTKATDRGSTIPQCAVRLVRRQYRCRHIALRT
jgi:hypothetical protein